MLDSSMQLSCNKWISEVVGQPITPEKLKLLDGEFTVYQHYQDYNQIAKEFEGTSESAYDMTPEYFDTYVGAQVNLPMDGDLRSANEQEFKWTNNRDSQ